MGKVREISSRLLDLNPDIAILIETRVKNNKAENIRKRLKLRGNYVDNYNKHENGRIWIFWNDNNVNIKLIHSTDQMVHCSVYDSKGDWLYWMTAIYAQNHLEYRQKLWNDIATLHSQQQGPWFLMGDFNNVLKSQDRIGGRDVTESEYRDLSTMMDITSLYEMDSNGDHFTWSNKQRDCAIYSRIERVIGNIDWLQKDYTLHVMHPSVSDHALLCLKSAEGTIRKIKNQFKFLNSSADLDGFLYAVANSWHEQISGRPMYMLWKKLQRLQPILKEISKPLSDVKLQISKARENLLKAQLDLGLDRMNADKIEVVKQCNDDLLNWQEIEEKILKQKSKLEWLKLGDGNNSYFHASIKTRSASKNMNVLYTEDGTQLTTQDDIEEEVMSFYSKLMGMADNDLNGVDITVMREGPQLNNEQREKLTGPITDKEITDALQSIGDLKSPSIDGYGAYFFKKAWNIVKPDVLGVVHDFFDNDRLYKAANCTLVTLIPKTNEAKKIKEYRPIFLLQHYIQDHIKSPS
ncbi:unnamed protein product [Trifolium pratense]|uniref:Uncharacterized protein n=1 Tax=Trifolium pratense TaxID=57577 RepID=A0ACB0K6H1_TRIPR|nr:unnamed protein product [Trifolium pratense]